MKQVKTFFKLAKRLYSKSDYNIYEEVKEIFSNEASFLFAVGLPNFRFYLLPLLVWGNSKYGKKIYSNLVKKFIAVGIEAKHKNEHEFYKAEKATHKIYIENCNCAIAFNKTFKFDKSLNDREIIMHCVSYISNMLDNLGENLMRYWYKIDCIARDEVIKAIGLTNLNRELNKMFINDKGEPSELFSFEIGSGNLIEFSSIRNIASHKNESTRYDELTKVLTYTERESRGIFIRNISLTAIDAIGMVEYFSLMMGLLEVAYNFVIYENCGKKQLSEIASINRGMDYDYFIDDLLLELEIIPQVRIINNNLKEQSNNLILEINFNKKLSKEELFGFGSYNLLKFSFGIWFRFNFDEFKFVVNTCDNDKINFIIDKTQMLKFKTIEDVLNLTDDMIQIIETKTE